MLSFCDNAYKADSVQQIYLRHKVYEQAIKIFHENPFSHQAK